MKRRNGMFPCISGVKAPMRRKESRFPMSNYAPIIQEWRDALHWIVSTYDRKRDTVRHFHWKLFAVLLGINIACYWFAMMTTFPELTFGARWMHFFKMQVPVGILAAAFEQVSVYITVYLMRHALASTSTRKYLGHLCVDVGIDFVIGFIAALWVVFSFTFSSWLVNYTTKLLTPAPVRTAQVQKARPAVRKPANRARTPRTRKTWKEMTLAERRQWMVQKRRRDRKRLERLRGTARDLEAKGDMAVFVLVDSLQHPFKNWKNFYFGSVLGSTELLPSLLHFFFALRALFKLGIRFLIRPKTRTT